MSASSLQVVPTSSKDGALRLLGRAESALAECQTVMQTKDVADIATAMEVYLQRTHASVEAVNRATEVRLLAERQMGEFLKIMPKSTGARGVGPNAVAEKDRINGRTTLASLGISKDQSSRSQKLADIPKPEFEGRLRDIKATGGRITTAALMRGKVLTKVNSLEHKPRSQTSRREDSPKLTTLKSTWRLTGQRDRKAFLLWIETQR